MKFSPSRELTKIAAALAFLLLVAWSTVLLGCSATTEQQDAMPQVEAGPWHIAGQLELSNGVVIHFGADSALTSQEGLQVERLDFDVSGGLLLNGATQVASFEYRGSRGSSWLSCLLMKLDVAQWQALVGFPMSDACDNDGRVELRYRPFRAEGHDEPPAID